MLLVRPFPSRPFINVPNLRTVVYSPPVAMLHRTKNAVSLGSDQCFHSSFVSLVTSVSWWVECLAQRSKHLSRGRKKKKKKTSFKLDTAACCCFFCLFVCFKYRLLDLLGSVQHLIHRLQWKPRICVLIISSVSASVSEHPCQFERSAALRTLLRNRREDAVKVTTLHNLTHRMADLGCWGRTII